MNPPASCNEENIDFDSGARRSSRARKPRQFDATLVHFPDDLDDIEVEEDPEQGLAAEYRGPVEESAIVSTFQSLPPDLTDVE